MPLPDVAVEGGFAVDLELVHVDLLAEQLLDRVGREVGADLVLVLRLELGGELLEVADERNDRAFRSQVCRGLAQEFGVDDVMSVLSDHALDAAQKSKSAPPPAGGAERIKAAGIASVTATCLELLGFVPPDDLEPSLLRFR